MNGKGDTQRPKRITDAEWDARYAGTFCADYAPVMHRAIQSLTDTIENSPFRSTVTTGRPS